MSTELENPKISEAPSTATAPPAKEAVTANGPSARAPKVWQRRRFQIRAGAAAKKYSVEQIVAKLREHEKRRVRG